MVVLSNNFSPSSVSTHVGFLQIAECNNLAFLSVDLINTVSSRSKKRKQEDENAVNHDDNKAAKIKDAVNKGKAKQTFQPHDSDSNFERPLNNSTTKDQKTRQKEIMKSKGFERIKARSAKAL
ncbi:hypothetical protein L1987_35519 [Smallanthus sonchifolius]|uniref:Uncharacterized protein n=1 Tax=Smallanthus sonchifolius TaxID=185202 RepID=A0ACB9HY00_9ASTR|nr:hypothetical protein L1987_35519 [Smallanthus sonchifolius]